MGTFGVLAARTFGNVSHYSACGLISEALFGYGIVPTLREGIAAQDAPYRQNKSDKKATFLKCLEGIGGAGWCKPAAGRFYGGDKFPVEIYQTYH